MATPALTNDPTPEIVNTEQRGELRLPIPHGLPDSKNADGRPVWEPPIFAYDELIREEYDQKRKAYLKYTNNNVVKTTEMLDTSIELDLLYMYVDWIHDNNDYESDAFFQALRKELWTDECAVRDEWSKFKLDEIRMKDGTWEIRSNANSRHRNIAKMRVPKMTRTPVFSSSSALSTRSATPDLDIINEEDSEQGATSLVESEEPTPLAEEASSDSDHDEATAAPIDLLSLWR